MPSFCLRTFSFRWTLSLLQCDLVFAFKLFNFGRRRPSALDAGAGQHCVTLKLDVKLYFGTGRRGESARCHPSRWAPERASNVSLCPAPWSGRAVSEEDEEDANEELFRRGSPPFPWPMVEGGWGELYCSQNVERSLPITVKQSLGQQGHGKGGGSCRDARGAPRGETFTNHPLSLRACSPTTTRV